MLFILVLHLSKRRSQDVGLLPTRSKHRCWRLSIVIDTKFHGVTAGLLDQVPEIRFNHRCNGNIEKGRKVSERQRENWWAAFSKEVVSPCRCFTTRNYISLITSYELCSCSYHEYSWIILRIHQNEWITRIWCLDSPWVFLGDLSQQAIPLENFYPNHLHLHDALSQHQLGSALHFLTWQGGYKKCRPRPCRLKKHITGPIFIRKGATATAKSYLSYDSLNKKYRFRGVHTFVISFRKDFTLDFILSSCLEPPECLSWVVPVFVRILQKDSSYTSSCSPRSSWHGQVSKSTKEWPPTGPKCCPEFWVWNMAKDETQQIGIAPDWGCILCPTLIVRCDVRCRLFLHHCTMILSLQCPNDLRQPVPLLLPRIAMSSEKSLNSASSNSKEPSFYCWFLL